MLGKELSLVVHTGDVVYPSGLPAYYQESFFDVYRESLAGTPWFPCPGNHDIDATAEHYRAAFHLPEGPTGDELNYSFDAADAHFVSMSSPSRYPPAVLEWLAVDLESTSKAWKIVFFHEPPYSSSRHGGEPTARELVVPILEEHGVDLVVCGHEHVYERTYPLRGDRVRSGWQEPSYVDPSGIVYLVSGGGGAGLYTDRDPMDDAILTPQFRVSYESMHHAVFLTITRDELTIEARANDDRLIDRATIRKDPGGAPSFRYFPGDVNGSGGVNIVDPIAILVYLLDGDREICTVSADANGDRKVDITDAVALLTCLFQDATGWGQLTLECMDAAPEADEGCLGDGCI
jgi:predicted phosphodiesterase